MSKKIDGTAQCRICSAFFPVTLYRIIWVEYPENLDLVLSGRINITECPKCGSLSRVDLALLCSNVQRKYAIWSESHHDSIIDKDVDGHRMLHGPNHFYARAPRIADWSLFIETLSKMDAAPMKDKDEICISSKFGRKILSFYCKCAKKPDSMLHNKFNSSYSTFSVLRQQGQMFVSILKDLTQRPDANEQCTREWQIIKNWLRCSGEYLT